MVILLVAVVTKAPWLKLVKSAVSKSCAVITSALKNVGTGVELTIKDLVDGNFKGGISQVYDLSNGGVGYEDTKHLTDEVKEFVNSKINK